MVGAIVSWVQLLRCVISLCCSCLRLLVPLAHRMLWGAGGPETGAYEYCYQHDGYCCSNCQENKAGKFVCCAAGTLPCNQGGVRVIFGFEVRLGEGEGQSRARA